MYISVHHTYEISYICFHVQPLVSGGGLPSVATLVVTEPYSAWRATQMLFSHLPLLKILFNLLTHASKKVDTQPYIVYVLYT